MSTGNRFMALVLAAALITLSSSAMAGPGLGREAGPDEIAAWDITVTPDGKGLPPGSGTALEGETVYRAKCAGCHGEKGAGGQADRLVGGIGTLASKKPVKTVGSYWPYAPTLFDYIRRAMPYNAPKSLSDDEIYALSAYILFQNGIIDQGARMDAKTLPQVQMPNRDGFVKQWP